MQEMMEPVAGRLAVGLSKIGLALKHHAWQAAAPRGITPTQGQVLALLRTHTAGLRLAAVADQLAVTPATASDAVRALIAKRLVEKRRDDIDARAIRVTLTVAGRVEAERVAGWPDFLAAAAETLSPAEQVVFLRAIIKLIRELQERGDIPVARMCTGCRYFRPYIHADAERPHHCAYVDAPFGDRSLRLDCLDFAPAGAEERDHLWATFVGAGATSIPINGEEATR